MVIIDYIEGMWGNRQAEPIMCAQTVLHFIRLTRPLFLAGGVLLYALGAAAALLDGSNLHIGRFILGQALVTCIQLMTHYANEYFDQESDRLNTRRTWFSGGSGVLVSGELDPQAARLAAIFFALLGGLALLLAGLEVRAVFLLGVLALAAAWSYSGPPLVLVRTGWGELAASLVVAGMVPLVGYAMQSGGAIRPSILVIILPLVLIHFAMLIAFQVPDREADALTGKRTLFVRFGAARTARLHNAALLAGFCVIVILAVAGWPGARLAAFALPLAAWQAICFGEYTRGAALRYTWLTARALGIFALTATLLLAGYAWIWIRG